MSDWEVKHDKSGSRVTVIMGLRIVMGYVIQW